MLIRQIIVGLAVMMFNLILCSLILPNKFDGTTVYRIQYFILTITLAYTIPASIFIEYLCDELGDDRTPVMGILTILFGFAPSFIMEAYAFITLIAFQFNLMLNESVRYLVNKKKNTIEKSLVDQILKWHKYNLKD